MNFQTVHIESSGGQRFISLPNNFEIKENKFYLKQVGETIFLIPFHQPWKSFWDSLELFSDDFLQDRSQPESQKRENL